MAEIRQNGNGRQAESSGGRHGKYLTFLLGKESFGLQILKVREIIGAMGVAITPIPKMPAEVRGVINLRGVVIPIIDLRLRFGLPRRADDRDTCIIVLLVDANLVGIAVDAVSEVLEIAEEHIDDPPVIQSPADTSFLLGLGKVAEKVNMLLDIEKVLAVKELMLAAAPTGETAMKENGHV